MKIHFSKLLVTVFCSTLVNVVSGQVNNTSSQPASSNQTTPKFPEASTVNKSKINYKIIDAANKTYCYDIFSNGKLMIHQPSVPGMPGNNGFKTKAQAEKVAQLVVKKIMKGEMPPSVTKEEMQKLGALK